MDVFTDWNADTKAMAVGVFVTLVATAVLWMIPWFVLWYYSDRWLIRLEAPKYRQYRLFGGFFGGMAVGLISSRTDPVGLRGAYAALVGGAGVGIVYLGVNLLIEVFAYPMPHIVSLAVMTLLILLPILPSFAIGGFIGGYAGRELRYLWLDFLEYTT